MAKAEERADVVKAEAEAERVFQEGQRRQMADGGEIPVLFGNENFVHDTPRGRRRGKDGKGVEPRHTQEEWLVEAGEVVAVMERGDHVSPELIEMLFLDAYDVIEGFTPAGTRGGKKKENETVEETREREREEQRVEEKREAKAELRRQEK